MEGRESRKDNDLFYTCSLIDYIARKTNNRRADVVNTLGKKIYSKYMSWLIFTIVTISSGSVMILLKRLAFGRERLIISAQPDTVFPAIGI